MFVRYWEIHGFAIVEIHEGIVITSKTVLVIVEYRFRHCEMLVTTRMRVVIGVDLVSLDTPPSHSVVGNWFRGGRRIGRTNGGGVRMD